MKQLKGVTYHNLNDICHSKIPALKLCSLNSLNVQKSVFVSCSSGLCIISVLYNHNTSIYRYYHLLKQNSCPISFIQYEWYVITRQWYVLKIQWYPLLHDNYHLPIQKVIVLISDLFFNKLSLQYIKEGQPHYINRHLMMIWDQHYSKQFMFHNVMLQIT